MRSIVLTLTLGLTAVGLISAAALPQTPSSVLANQRQDVPSLGCQLVGVHAIVRRDPYASPDPLEHRLARSASTHESNKRTKSAERDTAGPSSLSPREPPLVYCVTGRLTGGQFSRSFALSVNVWNVYWEVDRPALGTTVAVFETDGLDPYGSVVGMAAIIRRSLNAPFTARAGKEYYVELTGPIVGAVKWYVATQ